MNWKATQSTTISDQGNLIWSLNFSLDLMKGKRSWKVSANLHLLAFFLHVFVLVEESHFYFEVEQHLSANLPFLMIFNSKYFKITPKWEICFCCSVNVQSHFSCKRASVYLLDHITENQLKTYFSKI